MRAMEGGGGMSDRTRALTLYTRCCYGFFFRPLMKFDGPEEKQMKRDDF